MWDTIKILDLLECQWQEPDENQNKEKNSSSPANNLVALLSFHFGQATFMPWLLNTQLFCKAVLVASFRTTKKKKMWVFNSCHFKYLGHDFSSNHVRFVHTKALSLAAGEGQG